MSVIAISCASVPRSVEDYPIGYRETGLASWYGEEFHGRPTANGERYDMYGMTAAHRLMPLGTAVRVTHRENGRSVMVKINDRGPFVRGRVLDLSYGAAKSLGMVETGTAPVAIEVVSHPPASVRRERGLFTVQVGAFEMEENARRLAHDLKERYTDVYLVLVRTNQKMIYRVRVGALTQRRLAFQLAERLSKEDRLDAFVMRRDP